MGRKDQGEIFMRYAPIICGIAATLAITSKANAQTPGVTMEMIRTALPLEGAPRAEHGRYQVMSEPAFESPRHVAYRPADLRAFPSDDSLPVLVWGNGGCAINSGRYGDILTTVASHGFIALATAAIEGEAPRNANAEDLRAAIDWVEAENARAESPLAGKIATDEIAVMGTSCGGYMAIELGSDPRVDTIGVFNSGVQDAGRADRSPSAPTPAALPGIHGPVLLINGHERDFLMDESRATFDALGHVPAFYGARHNAGHSATIFHPGGGEFANVAVAWLQFQFKSDEEAGHLFVGPRCGFCTLDTWDTDSRGLSFAAVQTAETERAVMRHIAGNIAGDASVIPRDYAKDAVVLLGGTSLVGVEAIQAWFADHYARTTLRLDYSVREFEQNVGYLRWTTGQVAGSDTFIVRGGKIVAQTGVVFRAQ